MTKTLLSKLSALRADTSGLAMIEFAYALPVLLALGGFGLEVANLTTVNQRVSQTALALADNMSRVGATSALAQQQLREADVNDGFQGLRRQTDAIELTKRGRVILSSLQQNNSNGQWIAWQRCVGVKNVSSAYGAEGAGTTGTGFPGMGPATARVTAPPNSAVMFVEVIYDYKSLFGTMFLPARTIRYEASFVVRDERDLRGGPAANGIFNPAPVAGPSLCSTYAA